MTALWIIGGAIIINAAIFGGTFVWSRRQVRDVAAERAAEYRGLFQAEPLPPQGEEVQILIDEDGSGGMPMEVDAVHWPSIGWVDARTLLPVEDDVIGWRRHPFRQPPPIDHSRWTREEVETELQRRFGADANE